MTKQFSIVSYLLVFLILIPHAASASTDIILNGKKTAVYFNDGDSFKVLSGPLKGKRSRLHGYNTLEAHGPVHRWGSFTRMELLNIANEGTKMAQRGGWHCKSDDSVDTYGRMLATCNDLASALISDGIAHVMSINKEPGDTKLVALQQKAIKEKRGMWAKGVPAYVLSSLHSIEEKDDQEKVYNRAVSTLDGHSELLMHQNAYQDCEEVCYAPTQNDLASCMIYVRFENRYGRTRASCLKHW